MMGLSPSTTLRGDDRQVTDESLRRMEERLKADGEEAREAIRTCGRCRRRYANLSPQEVYASPCCGAQTVLAEEDGEPS